MPSVIIGWYTAINERYTTGHTIQYIAPKHQENHLLGIPNQRILSTASAAMSFRIRVKNSITQVNTTNNPFSRKPRIIWMSKVDRTIFFMKKLEK